MDIQQLSLVRPVVRAVRLRSDASLDCVRYLKQSLSTQSGDAAGTGRYTSMNWHAEDPLRLILTTASTLRTETGSRLPLTSCSLDQVFDYKLVWDTCASTVKPPNDFGSVVVVDGGTLLLISM